MSPESFCMIARTLSKDNYFSMIMHLDDICTTCWDVLQSRECIHIKCSDFLLMALYHAFDGSKPQENVLPHADCMCIPALWGSPWPTFSTFDTLVILWSSMGTYFTLIESSLTFGLNLIKIYSGDTSLLKYLNQGLGKSGGADILVPLVHKETFTSALLPSRDVNLSGCHKLDCILCIEEHCP